MKDILIIMLKFVLPVIIVGLFFYNFIFFNFFIQVLLAMDLIIINVQLAIAMITVLKKQQRMNVSVIIIFLILLGFINAVFVIFAGKNYNL